MYGASAYPQIENTFYLINNTNENLEKNFKFLQAFFAGTQWLNLYAGVVQSSNVYNVICPGRFQLMWCSINAKISYAGKLRKNISMTKYSEKIKSIDIDTLWPDAWKVEITIKSLVPNNYNTHIDYYVNGMNSAASLIKNDAAYDVDFAKKYSYKNIMDMLNKKFKNTDLSASLSAVLIQQKQYEEALATKAAAEKRRQEIENAQQIAFSTQRQFRTAQENFENSNEFKNYNAAVAEYNAAKKSGDKQRIEQAKARLAAATEEYRARLGGFEKEITRIVDKLKSDKTLGETEIAKYKKFSADIKQAYGDSSEQNKRVDEEFENLSLWAKFGHAASSTQTTGENTLPNTNSSVSQIKDYNNITAENNKSDIVSQVQASKDLFSELKAEEQRLADELAEQNRILNESNTVIQNFENTAMNSGDTLPNEKNATVNNGT